MRSLLTAITLYLFVFAQAAYGMPIYLLGGRGEITEQLDPSGAGTYTDATVVNISGCATKTQCVNDENALTLLQWQNNGDVETYALDNLSSITTANKITICANALYTSGVATIQFRLRIDGADTDSANVTVSSGILAEYCANFTGSWSAALVNGAEAGIDLVDDGGGAVNVSEIDATVYGYE